MPLNTRREQLEKLRDEIRHEKTRVTRAVEELERLRQEAKIARVVLQGDPPRELRVVEVRQTPAGLEIVVSG